MKIKYIEEGLVKKADTVDMGALLLYPREEWDRRFRNLMYRDSKIVIKISVLIIGLPLVILFLVTRWLDQPLNPMFFSGLLVLSILPLLTIVSALHYLLWSKDRSPVIGLYERGIMDNLFFVTYEEIEKFEENKLKSPFVKERTYLSLEFKPAERKWYQPKGTMVDTEFLGPEGVYYLHWAIKAAKEGQEGPPKLVVYRGRGGVAKREWVPEVEDA